MEHTKKTFRSNKTGFTLVELIISIAVFMIFIGIATSSYAPLVKANKTANETQKIYRETRFVTDAISREIKTGALDYSCIDQNKIDALCLGNQGKEIKRTIAIISPDGTMRTLFKFDTTNKNVLIMRQTRLSAALPWSAGEWEQLSSDILKMEDMSFSFFPEKNPYESKNAGADALQWQPSVSIMVKTNGYDFRTTYSSRVYGKQSLYQ